MAEIGVDVKEEQVFNNLAATVKKRFEASENARNFDEDRWLKAYRNYRGIYGNEMAFTEKEKSKVFVKITKTKVLASFGQLIEVLFGSGTFPLGIDPTPVPEGVAEYAKELGEVGFEEGPAPDLKSMPQIEPAAMAAAELEKYIHDQLDGTKAVTILRHVFFEMALLGTGVLKGPFNYNQTVNRWMENPETGEREYVPETKLVPKLEAVSCWDFYPDPNAVNMDDAEYVIQRHVLNRSQMRDLMNRPLFREDAIRACFDMGYSYTPRSFESSLQDRENQNEFEKDRFEVYEYWGIMDKEFVEQAGLPIDIEDDLAEVQINAWVSASGQILRLALNPFTPERLPFSVCPYELNPYQFFGVGIPENMDDSQQIMNGHARMAIDNLALAGNLIFDIDETMLVPGQDMSVYPGKIFRRQSGMPGQSIHGVKFPSTANENMMMFDRFRQLADESTGMPSYSHGQTGIQSTTRTAAGMSMLMGASALNIKTVIKNIDDYLLRPLGESLFSWNMQFNNDSPKVIGDIEIKPRGTSALMQKEVRSQRLMTFMQTASNPSLAPFVKWHTILSEIAKTLDIDPSKVINDPEKAAIYAQIMGMVNGIQENTSNGGQSAMGSSGGVPAGANPNDPTGSGGGNIGTGSVPQAGESGFSASDT